MRKLMIFAFLMATGCNSNNTKNIVIKAQKPLKEQIYETEDKVEAIRLVLVETEKSKGATPQTFNDTPLKESEVTDPWDGRYTFEKVGDDWIVRSNGPDRKPNTDDDIASKSY